MIDVIESEGDGMDVGCVELKRRKRKKDDEMWE